MALTPLEIQKMRFRHRLRGYAAEEVEDFLALVAEELTLRLQQLEKLEGEAGNFRHRLREAEERERELQQTLVRAQKVAEEIAANAHREGELIVKEAEMTADRIVGQAVSQATHLEGRISELRARRRELHLKFRNTLDLFRQILEADMEDDRTTATVHTLPRPPRKASE